MANVFKTEIAPLLPWDEGKPVINGPSLYGVSSGKEFLYRIPCVGERPLVFSCENLPEGLTVDRERGVISGTINEKGRFQTVLRAENRLGHDTRAFEIVAEGQLALTPPMGWNSWNAFRSSVSSEKIRLIADCVITTGLAARGYAYVNVDSCWQSSERGGMHEAIMPNSKFPDMKGLADYVHSKGLKFGIYSTPWVQAWGGENLIGCSSGEPDPESSCKDAALATHLSKFPGRYIGLEKHEKEDAKQFADWDVDFLKYDWMPTDPLSAKRMADQLNACQRDIVFSVCTNAYLCHGEMWKKTVNMFRNMGDTDGTWESIYNNGITADDQQSNQYHGPGCWWDLDMMVLGPMMERGDSKCRNELTQDEQITHMSLWSIRPTPLLISCNLDELDEFTLSLLCNEEVIAVNQDPLGLPAERIIYRKEKPGTAQEEMIVAKPLVDGSTAVGIFNLNGSARHISFSIDSLGIGNTVSVRDLWAKKEMGCFTSEFSMGVPVHGAQILRFSKVQLKLTRKGQLLHKTFIS